MIYQGTCYILGRYDVLAEGPCVARGIKKMNFF